MSTNGKSLPKSVKSLTILVNSLSYFLTKGCTLFWGKKKKETEEEVSTQGPIYTLELKIEGVESQEIPVEGELLIGSSENAQICIEGADLIPEHAAIRLQNNILSIFNYASQGSFIEDQQLQKSKSYVIDHGDTLRLGAATFIVKRVGDEIQDGEQEVPSDTKSLLEEDAQEEIKPEEKKEESHPVPSQDNSYNTSPTITGMINNIEGMKENARKEQKLLNEIIQKNKEKQAQDPESSISKKFKLFSGKPAVDPSTKMKQSFIKGSFFPLDHAPGAFTRCYAIFVNLCIAYALLYSVFPVIDPKGLIDNQFSSFAKMLQPSLENAIAFPKELNFIFVIILKFYLIHCTLDLIWSLLIGISLPLRLLGIHTEDSSFLIRFKGFFRSLIGAFTTPLIIFDLPILFGYKSFKELLTLTQYTYHSQLLRYASIFLILPLTILICFVSPVFQHIDNFTTLSFDNMKEEQELGFNKKTPKAAAITASGTATASVTPPVEINWQVRSEVFGVKAELRFTDNLIILPSGSTGVIFLDKNKDSIFSQLTFKSEINFEDLLFSAPDGNPFFFILFNSIHDFLETKNKIYLANPEVQKDFNHLLVGSLKLNSQMIKGDDPLEDVMSVGRYLIEYGPFITGYLHVRDNAIKKLELAKGSTVSLLNQKVNDFIRISPNTYTIRYALVSSPEQTTPIIEYHSSHPVNKLGMKVVRQILDGRWEVRPTPTTPTTTASTTTAKLTLASRLTQMEKENAFSMVDYLSNLKKNPDQPIFESINVSNFFRNEFEKVRGLPPESPLLKKFNQTVIAYAQELKQLAKPDDISSQQLVNELELIAKGEIPAPASPMTASESTPLVEPTPTPTPMPTATPTPEPVLPKKKKGKK